MQLVDACSCEGRKVGDGMKLLLHLPYKIIISLSSMLSI
jgi:hypothetical protein